MTTKGKGSAWLWGCGIGCGAALLVAGLVTVGGVVWMRGTMKGFESAVETRQQIDDRFGDVESYTPPPDGAPDAGRIEAFLAVRDALNVPAAGVQRFFAELPINEAEARELESQSFGEKLSFAFRVTREGLRFPRVLGTYFDTRNDAMLAQEIGMGEYTYLYAIAYHVYLERPPTDGPGQLDRVPVEQVEGDMFETPANPDDTARWAFPRLHDNLIAILRNQREVAEDDGVRVALDAEITAMELDPRRLPWQDGLPPAIVTALDPYRDRFEATYRPATNAFALARNRKEGWSIRAD